MLATYLRHQIVLFWINVAATAILAILSVVLFASGDERLYFLGLAPFGAMFASMLQGLTHLVVLALLKREEEKRKGTALDAEVRPDWSKPA